VVLISDDSWQRDNVKSHCSATEHHVFIRISQLRPTSATPPPAAAAAAAARHAMCLVALLAGGQHLLLSPCRRFFANA